MADIRAGQAAISIPWREWTADSFQEARERDVPILLSISAVWCHWCRVMDRDTYRDPEVIRRVATELVPIRVDADRRPDINNRYNLGGWPTVALLTPDGVLLSGGTFLPEGEFLEVLDDTLTYYREQRADLEAKLERRARRRARIAELRSRLRGDVTPEIVDQVVEDVRKGYDPEHGGFGRAPKFPLPDTIDFALAMGHLRQDAELLTIARKTLARLAEGAMYDQVEGGFFRYSTTDDWSRPHYEKMLGSNARLLEVYLHAGQVLDQPVHWRTARGVLDYATSALRLPEGAFGGSAVADEEYYHLRADARAERNPPAVDPTMYTDWNAMMVSSCLAAAAALAEPYLADLALEALEAVWSRCYAPGAGLAHYYDGSPHLVGLLSDQAWMGRALLDAHAYLGRSDYLARAEELMGVVRDRLYDPEVGGYYDVPHDPEAQGRLSERLKLLEENAVAADLALRLHRLTGRQEYYETAADVLSAMAPLYRAYRYHAAGYGLAVYRFVHTPLRLFVVGDPAEERARALRQAALAVYDPNRVVQSLDPAVDGARLEELGLPSAPVPALYARRGQQTSPAVVEPQQVRVAAEAVPV